MQDLFTAIWHENVPRASWRAGESYRDYRGRFRGAFRTWAKAMYADQVVLTNLLRLGFGGADTPAKALGAAMHTYNDHAKQNRKDKRENRKTELQEYTAQMIRRALRFGSICEEDLTAHQRRLLRRLQAGELRMPKPDLQREDIVTKLARLQGYTFQ